MLDTFDINTNKHVVDVDDVIVIVTTIFGPLRLAAKLNSFRRTSTRRRGGAVVKLCTDCISSDRVVSCTTLLRKKQLSDGLLRCSALLRELHDHFLSLDRSRLTLPLSFRGRVSYGRSGAVAKLRDE